ncbi:34414_t:CDS:2, partial [Racocetra persica]
YIDSLNFPFNLFMVIESSNSDAEIMRQKQLKALEKKETSS